MQQNSNRRLGAQYVCLPKNSDTGSVSLSMVILMPALLFLMFLSVQAGIYFHAKNTADYAARGGVAVASLDGGMFEKASLEASERLKGSLVQDRKVTAGKDSTTVWVRVEGRAPSILPGIPPMDVSAFVSVPLEGWK